MIKKFRLSDSEVYSLIGKTLNVYGEFLFEFNNISTVRSLTIECVEDPQLNVDLRTVEVPIPNGFSFTYLSSSIQFKRPEIETKLIEFGELISIEVYQNAQQMDNEFIDTALFDECLKLVGIQKRELLIMQHNTLALFVNFITEKEKISSCIQNYDLRSRYDSNGPVLI